MSMKLVIILMFQMRDGAINEFVGLTINDSTPLQITCTRGGQWRSLLCSGTRINGKAPHRRCAAVEHQSGLEWRS